MHCHQTNNGPQTFVLQIRYILCVYVHCSYSCLQFVHRIKYDGFSDSDGWCKLTTLYKNFSKSSRYGSDLVCVILCMFEICTSIHYDLYNNWVIIVILSWFCSDISKRGSRSRLFVAVWNKLPERK